MTLWQKIKEVLFGAPLDTQFEKILKEEEKTALTPEKPLECEDDYKPPVTKKHAPVAGGVKTKGVKKSKY